MKSKTIITVLALTMSFVATGKAANGPNPAKVSLQQPVAQSDQDLPAKVLKQIRSNTLYGVFDWITVGASDGVVTLTG